MGKSERWKRKEENKLKKLILMRFLPITALVVMGFGAVYYFSKKDESKLLDRKLSVTLENSVDSGGSLIKGKLYG